MSELKQEQEGTASALVIGALGCAGLGAAAGIDRGVFAVVHDAAALPASVALVAMVLVPALYIATSMMGLAIGLSDLGAAVVAGLRACGVAALGLVAPMLFLLVTTANSAASRVLVSAVLLFVAVLGLRAIHARLYGEAGRAPGIAALYLLWSLIFLGIGAKVAMQNLQI